MSAVVLLVWSIAWSLSADMVVEVGVNPVQGLYNGTEESDGKPYASHSLREVFQKAQQSNRPDGRTQIEEQNPPPPSPLDRRYLYKPIPSFEGAILPTTS